MGCIFEFLFELIFEGTLELYMYLMLLILPQKMQSKKAEKTVRAVVSISSVILLLCMLIGIVLVFESHKNLVIIGRYLTFIPLGIAVLQIVAGCFIRFFRKNK